MFFLTWLRRRARTKCLLSGRWHHRRPRRLPLPAKRWVPGVHAGGILAFRRSADIWARPREALLEARILNASVRLMGILYRAVPLVPSIAQAAPQTTTCGFAQLSIERTPRIRRPDAFVRFRRLAGPPGPFVYLVLRSDAVDVVYGTMDGYAALGVPHMASHRA